MEGNAFREIPSSIVRGGAEGIIEFLFKRIEQTEPIVDQTFNQEVTDLGNFCNRGLIKIPEIPDSLKELNCDKNSITSIGHIIANKGSSLRVMSLNNNNIHDLGNNWALLKLEILKVSGNKLEKVDLGDLANLSNLRELDLSFNKIEKVKCSKVIASLLSLNLENNKINDISELTVKSLPCLNSLMIANNNLVRISPEIGAWPSLKALSLHGNPLKTLPQHIIQKGTAAVKSALRERLGN